MTVVPEVNLISNIGFGEDATNTPKDVRNQERIETKKISEDINHNPFMISDNRINNVYRENLLEPSVKNKIKFRVVKYTKKIRNFVNS